MSIKLLVLGIFFVGKKKTFMSLYLSKEIFREFFRFSSFSYFNILCLRSTNIQPLVVMEIQFETTVEAP